MRYCPECEITLSVKETVCPQCGHKVAENEMLVDVSPDGTLVLTSSNDRTLKIWQAGTGRCLQILKGHRNAIVASVCAWEVKRAVSCSSERKIRIWDLENGQCCQVLEECLVNIEAVAVAPDGRSVVSGHQDGTLKVWGLETGECLKSMSCEKGAMIAVSVTPDARIAAAGSQDRVVSIWDLQTGDCLQNLGRFDSPFPLETDLDEPTKKAIENVLDKVQTRRLHETV